MTRIHVQLIKNQSREPSLKCMSSNLFVFESHLCHRKKKQHSISHVRFLHVIWMFKTCIVSKPYIKVNSSILNLKSEFKILKFRTYIWPKRQPTIYLVASQRNRWLWVCSKHKLKVYNKGWKFKQISDGSLWSTIRHAYEGIDFFF